MGHIVKPVCEKCGYNPQGVTIGAGMKNFRIYWGAPALDKETNEIVTLNYFEKLNGVMDESKYVFYDEDEMFERSSDTSYYQWHDLKYQACKNFCPKCKTFNLAFQQSILFD
jgi:ribosomal protein S27AE